jgi:hypothetical protein
LGPIWGKPLVALLRRRAHRLFVTTLPGCDDTVLAEYQAHYNTDRPHQGIAQLVPADERDADPATVTDIDTRQIRRKPVLNGLINEYTRAA